MLKVIYLKATLISWIIWLDFHINGGHFDIWSYFLLGIYIQVKISVGICKFHSLML